MMQVQVLYQLLWTIVLAVALFYPVRQFIWALSVRREERRLGLPADEVRRSALKRRASVTSALLCFVFAVLYQNVLMNQLFGP
jgi:hypothetical protein